MAYFTFDEKGLIKDVNHTGSELLGVHKQYLVGRPFVIFTERGDRTIYESHRMGLFQNQTRQICELKIKPRNAPPFYARLQSVFAESAEHEAGLMRTALFDISDRKRAQDEKEKLIAELQDALTKIKTLSGLLPICAWCKKIRNDKGYWEQVEDYIAEHVDVTFTHGMCPECFHRGVAELPEPEKVTFSRNPRAQS